MTPFLLKRSFQFRMYFTLFSINRAMLQRLGGCNKLSQKKPQVVLWLSFGSEKKRHHENQEESWSRMERPWERWQGNEKNPGIPGYEVGIWHP